MRREKGSGFTLRFEASREVGVVESVKILFNTYLISQNSSLDGRVVRKEIQPGDREDADDEEADLASSGVSVPVQFTIELAPGGLGTPSSGGPADDVLRGMMNSYEIVQKDLVRSSRSLHLATLTSLLALLTGVFVVVLVSNPTLQVTAGVVSTLSSALSLYIRTTLSANKRRVENQLAAQDKRFEQLYRRLHSSWKKPDRE